MKSSLVVLGAVAGAMAQPHGALPHHKLSLNHNHHLNLEKRKVVTETVTVTVLECVLGGQTISEQECMDGVASGKYMWADGGSNEVRINNAHPENKPSPPANHAEVQPAPAPAPPPPPPPAAAPPPPPPAAAPPVEANSRVVSGFQGSSAANVARVFPSGQLSCSEFPTAYGAMAVDYLELGGWISIQKPGTIVKRGGFNNILTLTPNLCQGANCCGEGAYCSYACPTGYYKAQWPTMQGATGQSVGGLLCQNGKLVLTNPNSNLLCMPAAKQVTAYIHNKLDQEVSVCQTNYPGDEGMTIPLRIPAGAKVALPVLDSPNYWHLPDGRTTSAQYYLNPAGVPVETACRWSGGPNANVGNWAPMNIGSGWNGDMAYIGLFGNAPTTSAYLNYKITKEGDGMPCKYENEQVCYGNGFAKCNHVLYGAEKGCTVGLSNGQSMTWVLHN